MPRTVATMLMFQGRAEEAMTLYAAIFPSLEVTRTERWAAGEPGPEGGFKLAHVRLGGHELMIFESPAKHAFDFTPAASLFVECETEAEIDAAFTGLSQDGQVMMPLDAYGFSRKFAWVGDRFGVSWQLNLA